MPESMLTMNNPIYRRRRILNRIMLTVSLATLLFGLFWLFWLFWIILTLLLKGAPALSYILFTEIIPPPGQSGGLLNAVIGSVLMTGAGTLIGTPIGILAGTYLAEYGQRGWLAPATRFLNDVLLRRRRLSSVYLSTPSMWPKWGTTWVGPGRLPCPFW
jgi:phosphate transport system permease protein